MLALTAVVIATGRRKMHPAVVFPLVWGVAMLLIGAGQLFGYFDLSAKALLVFCLGVVSFVVGAMLEPNRKGGISTEVGVLNLNVRRFAQAIALLHLVMVPIAWQEIRGLTDGATDVFAAAYHLRASAINEEEQLGPIVSNYLVMGLILIPILFVGMLQKNIGKIEFSILAAPWLVLDLFANGRSASVVLIFVLVYLYITMVGGISWRAVVLFVSIFVTILVTGNLLVSKIGATFDDSAGEILGQSLRSFFDYALQGPILFSLYLEHPSSISSSWDALSSFCYILEKAGLCKSESQHQDFMVFTADGAYGNVYSLFFSMVPKYGLMGVVLFPFLYGLWASFHSKREAQSPIHLLAAALLFAAAVLSLFSDRFLPNLYFFLKFFLISTVVMRVFRKK
ncbi:MAG: oligosaccharide repeat unit polymerase [Proteobacteria bacterium]|nr:oligosaccharide repeat unit polymerase [Pseudomonadota bacterium]